MRSILAFGALSLVTAAGVFACGDDDNGGPSGTAGRGGTAGAGGASGGTGGASGGTGGAATGGTAGVGGGTAQLPPLPTATCSGCVVLTVSNNSATLVDGATQNQAGFLFSSPATAAPWDLSAVESITWRVRALTANAGYFVQPFLQTTPPEDPAYNGAFPAGVTLDPTRFTAGTWVDVVLDVAAIGAVVGPDAGADAGDAGAAEPPVVVEPVDAGDAGGPVLLTGYDKAYTRFVGINIGATPAAPLGWVSVEVDSVTVEGTTNFTEKLFTAGAEGIQLNMYQVPASTPQPAFRP